MNRMRVEIRPSLKVIKKDFFNVMEDVEIHIPLAVKEIEADAFICEEMHNIINVDFFYDGTIEEWNTIKKGTTEEKTTEDWYGHYYHNADRYETAIYYYSWFKHYSATKVIIHCKDGDSIQDDQVDRKNPVKEIK